MKALRSLVIGGFTLFFTPSVLSAQMWGETGFLSVERWKHTASLLPSGKVLIVGGIGEERLSRAEIFNPLSGHWEAASDLELPREGHTATTLPNGTVLIVGGRDSDFLTDARVYRPKCEASDACDAWEEVGSLRTKRAYHTATLMPSGKVMVVGGYNGKSISTVELYDPKTKSWEIAGSPNAAGIVGLNVARFSHTATLLTSGEVLVTGGTNGRDLDSVEIYDPDSKRWRLAEQNLRFPRAKHVAVRLASGKVLVVGGSVNERERAEIYDPVNNNWQRTKQYRFPKEGHTATLLPTGEVLVAGGLRDGRGFATLIFREEKNSWQETAQAPATRRSWHTATRLASGDILIVGGGSRDPFIVGGGSRAPLSSVELYQTEKGKWIPSAGLQGKRKQHTATLIAGDQVLLVGGIDGDEYPAKVRSYNVKLRSWSEAGRLAEPRAGHTATLLANGDLLVTGGTIDNSYRAVAELYDVGAEQWRTVGELHEPRHRHTATRLPSGEVLVVGGMARRSLAGAEIYDPVSATWRRTAPLSSPRHSHTATLLPSGKVLVTGGRSRNALAMVEIYDPTSHAWTRVADLPGARSEHAATLLPSGDVLITGGLSGTEGLADAAIYRPATGAWTTAGNLSGPRYRHTATLLHSGRVLVVGGYKKTAGSDETATFEFYQPATGKWSKKSIVWPKVISSLVSVRADHTATLLPSGEVLVVGDSVLNDVLLYRPVLSLSRSGYPRIQQHTSRMDFGTTFELEAEVAPDSGRRESETPIVHLRSLEGDHQYWLPTDRNVDAHDAVRLDLKDLPASINHGPHLISLMAGGHQGDPLPIDVGCSPSVAPLADRQVKLKEPATFTVDSQGGRFFQWSIKKPGEEEFVEMPGQTGPSYTTPAVAADDFGTEYRVWVSTGCDSEVSNAARLTLDDQSEPTVSLTLPAGGEKWLLSSSRAKENKGRIAWTMDDDAIVCQIDVHLLYSDDSGNTWSSADEAIRLDKIGAVENCLFPGQKRTELLYSVPEEPPSGRQGSLYRVEVVVTDQAGNISRPAINAKPFHIIKTSPVRNTLIVTNFSRMQETNGVSDQRIDRLKVALKDFAEHSSVVGEILELDEEASIRALYERWDGDSEGANDLLFEDGGIQSYIFGHVLSFQGVENIVVVGDDSIIPMARFSDETLYDERKYQSAVPPGSTVQKALAAKQYLSDDPLAVRYPIRRNELNRHFLPELNIGRLVETPEEIVQSIATFLGQDGVLDLKSPMDKVLVTAYDFLQDSGRQIRDRWFGAYEGRAGKPVDGDLISRDWDKTSVDERRVLLYERMRARGGGILSLNGHASHEAKYLPGMDHRQIAGLTAEGMSDLDLEGSVVYTVGCHGGLTVPGGSPDDHSLDLPQTFLDRGALAYLGNTGFGWGLTTGIGMSELLAVLFTQELTYGPEVVSIGDAVRRAKERFFYESTIWDAVYDVKTSHQWTLYGFPMYSIKTDATPPEMIRQATPFATRSEQAVDVERRILATPKNLPSNLTRLAIQLNFAEGSYTKRCPPNEEGCYYTLNGLFERASGESDLPIEPYFVYETRLVETSARDVLWLGGPYQEEDNWKPIFADLQSSRTQPRDRMPLPPRKLVVAPRKPRKPRRSTDDGRELRCQAVDDEINRVVMTTGELIKYKSADDAEKQAHRLHTGVDLEMFFFSAPSKSDEDCDRTPPSFVRGKDAVQHVNDGSSLHWTVSMADGEDDVWRVVVVWDDEYDNRWKPLELERKASGQWQGSLSLEPAKAEKMSELTYVVQAVDRHGNVSWLEKVQKTSTGPVMLPLTTTADVPIGEATLKTTLEGPAEVELGAARPFKVTVFNSGPQKANRVRARISVPTGSSSVSVSGRGWRCEEQQNFWSCEKKRALESRSRSSLLVYLNITDEVAVRKELSACAVAMERNPEPDGKCAEYSFGIRNSRIADLEVVNEISDLKWTSETEVSFKLTVNNNGPNRVNGATYRATFPPSLKNVRWIARGDGGHVARNESKEGDIFSRPTTDSGGSVTYIVTATVDPATQERNAVIKASVSVPNRMQDPKSDNNQVSIDLKLEPPKPPPGAPAEKEPGTERQSDSEEGGGTS